MQSVIVLVALAALVAAGCATGRAFARGEAAGRAGDWEAAVGFYRQALQDDPDRPDYKIALERAMVAAAAMYAERGRQFEEAGQLEEALRAYRKAQEFEPSNRQLSAQGGADRTHAARSDRSGARRGPRSNGCAQQARARTVEPILSPTNPEPLIVNFVNTSLRDILTFIGNYTGINVTFDRDFQDRTDHPEAGRRLAGAGAPADHDRQPAVLQRPERPHHHRRRRQHAEAHAVRRAGDPHVLHVARRRDRAVQLLLGVMRVAGMAIQPQIVANKTDQHASRFAPPRR